MNQRAIEAVDYLRSICLSNRSKALLTMAEERGFQDKVMYNKADGKEYPIPEYAMQLLCYAHTLGSPDENETESYLVVALLMAMEECKEDLWSYGAKLMTDTTRRQISISRKEWDAFLAQKGTSPTDPTKEILLSKNLTAISFYCADLITRVISLPASGNIPSGAMPAEIQEAYDNCWSRDPVSVVEALVKTFVPQSIGQEAYARSVGPMLTSMKRSGAFFASGHLNENGEMTANLAQHICNVIWRHCDIVRPQTEKDLGMIVLAGICSNLWRTNQYWPVYTSKKIFSEKGKFSEPDRRRFDWAQIVQFEDHDQIPMGDNKNLFMACRYLLADLPEAVANAIDACNNIGKNIYVEAQMRQEPLGLYLHLANVIASYYDDLRNGG